MSNIAIIEQCVYGVEVAFGQVASDKSINFRREAEFAIQVIGNSDYAIGIAIKNPQSVRDAVTNLAAIGLSLNPAKKQAYLVPRDGKICLDVSYVGLLELAIASGSVLWAKADVVREQDRFTLNGFDKPPTHEFNPFSTDRGAIVGAYVVVKTSTGDYLTDAMSSAEIHAIRDRSSAWKAWISKQKKCPWVTDESEMFKKTTVKRAYKMWPRTDRLDTAVQYLNTDGGEGLATLNDEVDVVNVQSAIQEIEECRSSETLKTLWTSLADECRNKKDRKAYDILKDRVTAAAKRLKQNADEQRTVDV